MATVTVTRIINARAEKVWDVWDDFANINDFNPNLSASYLLKDSQPTGLGAQRQCDLADGKNYLREKIVGYTPGHQMVVDVYESSMPLKSAQLTITVEPLHPDKSQVSMVMRFEPGMGLLGKMMLPMMKPKFAEMLNNLLTGNAAHVEQALASA